MPPEAPAAALRLDIDRDALRHNWLTLDGLSGSADAGAAIKADAYGLGAHVAVPALREAGCRDFFVAHPAEAAGVVGLLNPAQLSVLHGPRHAKDAAYLAAIGAKPVINTVQQARTWIEAGGGPCDLMVDTGINRLGVPMDALGDPAFAALDIDILLSHLACADEDVPLNAVQQQRWSQLRTTVNHRRASLANSAGIVLGPDYHGDLTRPGLSLYGGVPRAELADAIRPVVQPRAAIMQVRELAAGDAVGYNSTFVAPRPMRVGTIALGYADGYLRGWSGGTGAALHHGAQLPVLGRVSMDMTVIDLGAAPECREGDWVGIEYALPEAAARTGLSQYELLTILGSRFAR